MNLFDLVGRVRVDSTEALRELEKINKQAKYTSIGLVNIAKKATDIAIGVAIFRNINKSAEFLKDSVFGLNAQLQGTSLAFKTMLGSGQQANKMLEDLKDFASKTPFEFPELIDSVQRMKALGFEAQELIPTLKAIGDTASALGGGKELIDRITLALGQMKAKGRVSGEEMRQLAEAGIPAYEMLADILGTTVPEAMEKTKKEVINADIVVGQFVQKLEEKYPNMMKNMENTWQGATSTIKDNLRFLLADSMKSIFDKSLSFVVKFKDLTSQMLDSYKKGGFSQIFKDLVPADIQVKLQPVTNAFMNFINTIRNNWDNIKYLVKSFFIEVGEIATNVLPIILNFASTVITKFVEIGNWIDNHKGIVMGLVSTYLLLKASSSVWGTLYNAIQLFNGTLGMLQLSQGVTKGLAVAILELRTAPSIILGVKGALDALNLSMLASPFGLVIAGLGVAVGAYLGYKKHVKEAKELQEKFNVTAQETARITKEGISVDQLVNAKKEYEQLNNLLLQYKRNMETINKYGGLEKDLENRHNPKYNEAVENVNKLKKEFEKLGYTVELAEERVNALGNAIEKADKLKSMMDFSDLNSDMEKLQDIENLNTELDQAVKIYNSLAQKKNLNTIESEKLRKAINTLTFNLGDHIVVRDKEGKIIGVNTQLVQQEMLAQQQSAKDLKESVLARINARKLDIQSEIERTKAIIKLLEAQWSAILMRKANEGGSPMAFAVVEENLKKSKAYLTDLMSYLADANNTINKLNNIKGSVGSINTTSNTISNPKSNSSNSSNSSKDNSSSKTNTALDNAIKEYEYLKDMSKLTYQQEIDMLNNIKSKYAKTTEEKRELEVKIHDLQVKHQKEIEDLWSNSIDKMGNIYSDFADVIGSKSTASEIKLKEGLEDLKETLTKLGESELVGKLETAMSKAHQVVYKGSANVVKDFYNILSSISSSILSKTTKDTLQLKTEFAKMVEDINKKAQEGMNNSKSNINSYYNYLLDMLKNFYDEQKDLGLSNLEEEVKRRKEKAEEELKIEKEKSDNIISEKKRELDEINSLLNNLDTEEQLYKYDSEIMKLNSELSSTTDIQKRNELMQKLAEARHNKDIYLQKQQLKERSKQIELEINMEEERYKNLEQLKQQEISDYETHKKNLIETTYNNNINSLEAKLKDAFLKLKNGNKQTLINLLNSIIGDEFASKTQSIGDLLFDGAKTGLDLIKEKASEVAQAVKDMFDFKSMVEARLSEDITPTQTSSSNSTSSNSSSSNSSSSNNQQYTTYTIKKGDTLSGIASKYGTTWQKIYNANKDIIKDPNKISPNQVIKIPKYHTGGLVTKLGQNIHSIFNNLKNNEVPAILEVGEVVIPKNVVNKNFAFAGEPSVINNITNKQATFNITVYAQDGYDAGNRIALALKRYGF